MNPLNDSVQDLKGIGPAKAKALARLEIHTVGDLLRHFPRGYEDRTHCLTTAQIEDGSSVCCELMVADAPRLTHVRRGMDLVRFTAVDETGRVTITYFNQSWIRNSFEVGESYLFFGRFTKKGNRLELINPAKTPAGRPDPQFQRLVPLYPLTEGLTQGAMQTAIHLALEHCSDCLPEPVPADILNQYHLIRAEAAYRQIHFPSDTEEQAEAKNKFAFEEFYLFACAQKQLKNLTVRPGGHHPNPLNPDEFTGRLPFHLTGAQKRVIRETFHDMLEGDCPMNRLVQGDVGSGKTVIAAACCWLCACSGMQSAVMAPTEILAEQHYKTFTALLSPFGIRTALLTGSMTAASKKAVYEALKAGDIDIAVGTHAVISQSVTFRSLSLCVVDEQHRFGVLQRAALAQKGDAPHILVMSATPIPRTLALMIYGDLDVSVIDELPPGRQKIETYTVKEGMRRRIEAFARKQVEAGRQVYWICPMVEENEETEELKAAEETCEELKTKVFPDLRVGLLHGKLKPKEKESAISAFAAGETDILVATTVVEVGVDVPNATLMVIENADRFGLSQLHQLRGRIGRGIHQSYCILFDCGRNDTAAERLKVMCQTDNGFTIAETDLKLRGPGDFLGARQHGLPEMKIASLTDDMEVLHQAYEAAENTIAGDPQLTAPEHALLRDSVNEICSGFTGGMN